MNALISGKKPWVAKPFRRARDQALAQGWTITHQGPHTKWKSPDKTVPMVTVSTTPGYGRSVNNTLSKLRKAGLHV